MNWNIPVLASLLHYPPLLFLLLCVYVRTRGAVDFHSIALNIYLDQQKTYSLRNFSHFCNPIEEGISNFSAVYPTEKCYRIKFTSTMIYPSTYSLLSICYGPVISHQPSIHPTTWSYQSAIVGMVLEYELQRHISREIFYYNKRKNLLWKFMTQKQGVKMLLDTNP